MGSFLCPRCGHEAASLSALEVHAREVHQGAVKEAREPVAVAVAAGPSLPSLPKTNPVIGVPAADPTFWIDDTTSRFLCAVEDRSRRGEVANVLLVGPTGTGKSSLPREFAATRRHPFFTMHCQLIEEQGDWWGMREVSPEAGTYVETAALVDALETPGCVILLDEANRTRPENLNALFGLLDHRRRAWVPMLKREVEVAAGVVFFVTLNEGADYIGTNLVDRALRDRIANTIRLDYPPKRVEAGLLVKRTGVDEAMAWKLAEFAQTIRRDPKVQLEVSTRQLLECAALVRAGLPLRDAVLFSVVNGALEDTDRKALLQGLQVTGAVEEAYVESRWEDNE